MVSAVHIVHARSSHSRGREGEGEDEEDLVEEHLGWDGRGGITFLGDTRCRA